MGKPRHDRLRKLGEKAQAKFPRRSKGRPSDDIIRALIEQLTKIWLAQTGEQPTVTTGDGPAYEKRGDFLDFCEAIVDPIWNNRSEKPPSIKDFVKLKLYPRT